MIPGRSRMTRPTIGDRTYAFAPSFNESAGQSRSSATRSTNDRTRPVSEGDTTTASTSCVESRALYPKTMAQPPTSTSSTSRLRPARLPRVASAPIPAKVFEEVPRLRPHKELRLAAAELICLVWSYDALSCVQIPVIVAFASPNSITQFCK